jgi:Glycoside hydrolase 123 N-terminal domain
VATIALTGHVSGEKLFPGVVPTGAASISLSGAIGEGVAGQVALYSGTSHASLEPQLSNLTSTGGATFPTSQVFLYLVKYVNVPTASDTDPNTGAHPAVTQPLWPDALLPIGPDPVLGIARMTSFSLSANSAQPVWIDVRIPASASAGVYTGTLAFKQGATPVASIPIVITVWNFSLTSNSTVPSRLGISVGTMYSTHTADGHAAPSQDVLLQRYMQEALAHRMTLDPHGRDSHIAYTYSGHAVSISQSAWNQWDAPLADPRLTSYPLPLPGQSGSSFDDPTQVWTAAMTAEATALWHACDQHYQAKGWLTPSYFYCYDEPHNQAPYNNLVISQTQALAQTNDLPLRGMVVLDQYRASIASDVGIWVPNIVDFPAQPAFANTYAAERQKGARIWWYDSNNSRFTVQLQPPSGPYVAAVFPDHFIDHPGVNELVRGPLSYLYNLQGYLYYDTVYGYSQFGTNVWSGNYNNFGDNGDGTLFYPGTPAIIGGTTSSDIPVPSIRLQLLREAWSTLELLHKLDQVSGNTLESSAFVGRVVQSATSWSKNPADYETLRQNVANAILTAHSGG